MQRMFELIDNVAQSDAPVLIHGPSGTARRIGLDAPYRIAGKTGTAQVVRLAPPGWWRPWSSISSAPTGLSRASSGLRRRAG